MKIEKTKFSEWEAYKVTLGDAEMTVVTGIGPRIMSLSVAGGDNLLWVDKEGISRNNWRIYGGHRLWVSPETENCYAPDNDPCKADADNEKLNVVVPVSPMTGLEKRITISACGDSFVVEHGVLNASEMLATGAIWALTCVVPSAVIALPWGTGGDWDAKKVIYWNKWGGTHSSNIKSSQWKPTEDLFQIHPTGEEGKIGSNSPEAWIALCREDATFIKQFEYHSDATYPDDNCCVEAYTCENFMEMESLGPTKTLAPGEEMTHKEVWIVTSKAIKPDNGKGLRALLNNK